jgi:hypothetical protein
MDIGEWRVIVGSGVPPLKLGMSPERLMAELQVIGSVQDAAAPGGAPAWRVLDQDGLVTIVAHCLPDGRLFTIEIWRESSRSVLRSITVYGVDLFNQNADPVLQALISMGVEVSDDDPHYPMAFGGKLRFDRNGGDDPDDNGLSPRFESVLIVPADYESRYTNTTFPEIQ